MPVKGSLVSKGEFVNHFNAVRIRLLGEGNLRLRFFTLSNTLTTELMPLVMTPTTNIEPTRLANIRQQRISLEVRTSEFGEYFRINRIVVFSKRTATSYPL